MTDPDTPTPFVPLQTSTPTEVASVMTQLGAVLLSRETLETTVELVTRLAVETIPGTAGAGVTLVDARGRQTAAASDPFVVEVDALQYAFDSGPCLTAWQEQTTVKINDLALETRWPQWTAAASELGVQAMLSVPLTSTDASVGAIKVYSRQAEVYDQRAEQLLGLFAQQAGALLANMVALSDARRLSTELTGALANRDVIGQAKGVLMAQGAVDDQVAFALLAAASQRSNVKVHEVARRLIASVLGRNTHARPAS